VPTLRLEAGLFLFAQKIIFRCRKSVLKNKKKMSASSYSPIESNKMAIFQLDEKKTIVND
jgi:hypothetical protein